MTSVADSIGIRSHGVAGATLAILDLACARIFSLVRVQRIASALTAAGSSTRRMKLAVGDTGTITAKMCHFAIARIATELSIHADGFLRNDLRESR